MSFRRNNEKAFHWQKWLRDHRGELFACGIPHIVLEDVRNWLYFLEHGCFTPVNSAGPIIDVDRMSRSDALRLCLFLEQDDSYPDCSALNRLQFLLKRGVHAGVG
jgi:hypothetical protein